MFDLPETIRLLRESVREFALQDIMPLADAIDRDNLFPDPLWKKMGNLGVLGITVESVYGGADMGYLAHVIAMEEISRASASVGLSYGAHSNLCVNQIRLNGTESQKKRYLPRLIRGEAVGALAMSEVGAGSDVLGMQLEAREAGEVFVLNGHKMWITNGPDAEVLVVYAKTAATEKPSRNISAFIVERGFPGFFIGQKIDKLGMRGSNTAELIFKDCQVPRTNLLGTLHGGASVLMKGLDYERLVLAAGPVGIMQACLDLVLPYVRIRKQFGEPIGTFELIQGKLADMYTTLSAARAYLYQTALLADQQSVRREDAAGVILYCAEAATRVALETIQCLGGNGYTNEYPAGRFLRDAKLYEIGAGTSEIRRMLIGKALFQD